MVPRGTSVKYAKKDIVGIIMKIAEDGPMPMRNLRPAEKNRNVVDRFYHEHQEEYEARGKQSTNQIENINQHYETYPKMKDELNKKKSTGKVVMAARRDASKLLLTYNKKSYERFRNPRTKPNVHKNERNYPPKSKICKAKFNKKSSIPKLFQKAKTWMNKGCQCTRFAMKNKRVSCMSSPSLIDPSLVNEEGAKIYDNVFDSIHWDHTEIPQIKSQESNRVGINETSKVILDISKPERVSNHDFPVPSETSGSSYNSFMSIDHEPMLSP